MYFDTSITCKNLSIMYNIMCVKNDAPTKQYRHLLLNHGSDSMTNRQIDV